MMMHKKSQEPENPNALKDAFKVFDKNGDGTIDRDELFKIMTELGEPLTKPEVDEMIREADKDRNGVIDYEGEVNHRTLARCRAGHCVSSSGQ